MRLPLYFKFNCYCYYDVLKKLSKMVMAQDYDQLNIDELKDYKKGQRALRRQEEGEEDEFESYSSESGEGHENNPFDEL